MIRAVLLMAFVAAPVTATAKEPIPANVTLRNDKTVEKIDWSFTPAKQIEFVKLKRCAAITLKNDEVQITDGAGSFVGAYTGNYYTNRNSSTVAGNSVFKMVDDENKFLVAQGWIDKPVFALRWILRFDLELANEGASVKMMMRNLQLAMSNTGTAPNSGFGPLGSWHRFKQNYATLEASANAIKSCIEE